MTPPNLPNTITSIRVLLAPVVAILILQPSMEARLLAFVVFLIAALSDLWDGYLARRRSQITEFGKIVDPIADKLLIVSTIVPLYWISVQEPELLRIPFFGGLPLWTIVLLLGRELIITSLRFAAARHGSVVAATTIGKRKALAQNIFVGSALLLLAFRTGAAARDWNGPFWRFYESLNAGFTSLSLAVALVLTAISLVTYLTAFSRIFARQHT